MESREEKLKQLLDDLKDRNLGTYMTAFDARYSNYPVFYPEPTPFMTISMWRYEDIKKLLFKLREVIDPSMTDRVNIHLENSGIKKLAPEFPAPATPTMHAGVQIIGPKDRPPAHRHLTNGLRVGLEFPPEGGYTTVNGIRIRMEKGDVALTPAFTWHDHGNLGNDYTFWYDADDAPMTFWLGVEWYETLKDTEGKLIQDVKGYESDIEVKYSYNYLPLSEPRQEVNPVWYYPYKKTREALIKMSEKNDFGSAIELINPQNGGSALPTISLQYYLVKPGAETRPVRKTESIIMFPLEGEATFIIGDNEREYKLKQYDFITLPPWTKYKIYNEGKEPAIIFKQSDAPIYKKLEKYREKIY
ncbi:cupin domain-containing protein [Acidianus manzaensis]|uniref:Cupin type-2 domain-containing protein n=1 Tax=Acidianus manzaensis TaxID=282676 RepID=A0A1W6JYS9_9CREN|nr:cupin domain-containing protein [Acidianus manzaensis]ARM75418.1 hypothetical protein B6F84_04825 [Acidianus manzaensis]